MKKYVAAAMAALVLTVIFSPCSRAQEMTDAEILAAIREYPYRAAGGTCPYICPDVAYTPAPKGYKPFYISHFGRHGSRYQTSGDVAYSKVVELLDTLHSAKALTPEGDSLRAEILQIEKAHRNMEGMLTVKGTEEHKAIARRMAARSPEVFRQKDRKVVKCTSTTAQRTIQSMAGFVAGMASSYPGLDIRISCGFNGMKHFPAVAEVNTDSLRKVAAKAVSPSAKDLEGLQKRLFKGYTASVHDLTRIFRASATAACLDLDVDPLRFFTTEELFAFYRQADLSPNEKYGTFAPTREYRAASGRKWLQLIVDEADAALAGNGRCADLRFGHDGNVGPLMNLLGIGGYAVTAQPEAPYRYWQSFNQICMGSNIQFEFYKNRRGDILVKALFNEREAAFPGLEAVNGIYYRWSDVRSYMLSRIDKAR